ncbi:MAG: HlyD family efflux transporter periplasmic adaptor subunit [Cyclobacteriaceae bacterium]
MKTLSTSIFIVFLLTQCTPAENEADAYGNFEATEVMISAEVPGKVLTVNIDEGIKVAQGQPIALVDTTSLYIQKELIKASMDALEAKLQNVPVQLKVLMEKLEVLERERDRFTKLVEEGAANEKQLDDITGELKVVKSQLSATQSQLSTANQGLLAELKPFSWKLKNIEDQLSRCMIQSPIDGIAISVYKEEGEVAGINQPVAKIANLDKMTIRVYVSGDQLSSIQMGGSAEIRYDGPDGEIKKTTGWVSWISSKAEFTPKTIQTRDERVNQVYAVELNVPNDGALKIGMPGEVVFSK